MSAGIVTENNISLDLIRSALMRKVFFGHQSVGFNIINGMEDLIREYPEFTFNVIKIDTDSIQSPDMSVFSHATIGKNSDPFSKIEDFEKFLDHGVGKNYDIAMMKLCYVDLHPETDIVALFQKYRTTVARLANSYPQLKMVYFTVPLTSRQKGVKAWIKKILGKPLRGYEDNIQRNRFNDMMRSEYQGQKTLFDLAEAESTYNDGTREFFTMDGEKYDSLIPEYTDDGGHLNSYGSRIVAEKLLIFLSDVQ